MVNRISGVLNPQDGQAAELEKAYKEVASLLYVGEQSIAFTLLRSMHKYH